MGADWPSWHDGYEKPGMAQRLAAVRGHITAFLDETGSRPVRVISACAGDGRDLLGALEGRSDAGRVSALLVEYDAVLAERARRAAQSTTARILVEQRDAADSDAYAAAAPADLVLLCGVFGNIPDDDVRQTVTAARQLCAAGAMVIWTRHRQAPDLTPRIRQWFERAGFAETAFTAPQDEMWSVGAHRLVADPEPLQPGRHWFTFIR